MNQKTFLMFLLIQRYLHYFVNDNRYPFLGNPFLPNFRKVAPQIGISALLGALKLPQRPLSAVQGPAFSGFGDQG